MSRKKITIGKNSTISWNTLLMDTDKIMTNPISWNLYALARKSKHMVNKYIFRI